MALRPAVESKIYLGQPIGVQDLSWTRGVMR
jgi:hypothetical protein